MYKIPIDFDFSQLNNQIVDSICYSLSTIGIHLSKGDFIQTSGPFFVMSNGVTTEYSEVYPLSTDCDLLPILDKEITKITPVYDISRLIIEFSNGLSLILDSDDYYESYILRVGTAELLI